MPNILILFAHPALEHSSINRRLIADLDDIESVTFHDLYEAYPDMHIDVEREQQLLAKHDIIIFQHPLYWYSSPAILKEWQDLVLTHGWAFGDGATALLGKSFLQITTAGGDEKAYRAEGSNRYSIRELFRPFELTARLCGMRYLAPYVIFDTLSLQTEKDLQLLINEYQSLLISLRDGTVDLDAAEAASLIRTLLT